MDMDILEELKKLPTTCLSDVTGNLNNMDPAIAALIRGDRLVGPALTARLGYNDNAAFWRAIRAARPGQVLVADAKALRYNAVAGDFVIGMAKVMGIAGIVVDGSVRDIEGIRAVGLPLFCRGTTVTKPSQGDLGEVDTVISCGGVPVAPGDWIVADADGVTVIPRESVTRVIEAAKARFAMDEERDRTVLVSRDAVCRYIDYV